MGNEQTVPAMAEDVEIKEEVQKLKKELKYIKKKIKKSQKLEERERKRADLKELLQIKTEQDQSSLNQHTEQMEWQFRLVEVPQIQAERPQEYFGEYEGTL